MARLCRNGGAGFGVSKKEYERVRSLMLAHRWTMLVRARQARAALVRRARAAGCEFLRPHAERASRRRTMPAPPQHWRDELTICFMATRRRRRPLESKREELNAKLYRGTNRSLAGLEAVPQASGMYIGNTAERGLHQLVYEAVDNAVDEALAGSRTAIARDMSPEGAVSVEDNGRGFPVDIHAEEKLPAVEVVMTILHAGGKFGKGGYKVSGGLHGVGISVVNALSEEMMTRVKRDGNLYEIKFDAARPRRSCTIGKAEGTGTCSGSSPIRECSRRSSSRGARPREALRELAFLNRGLNDQAARRTRRSRSKRKPTSTRAGSSRSSSGSTRNKEALTPVISTNGRARRRRRRGALQWTDGYNEVVYSYANNINTIEGGMHLTGFRTAVTNAINAYARKRGMLKENERDRSPPTTAWKA